MRIKQFVVAPVFFFVVVVVVFFVPFCFLFFCKKSVFLWYVDVMFFFQAGRGGAVGGKNLIP